MSFDIRSVSRSMLALCALLFVATACAFDGGVHLYAEPTPRPDPSPTPTAIATNANGTPALKHVFVIALTDQAEDNTFGALMPVPYLTQLEAQGAFVPNYWGTSHSSLGNYVSLISGQSTTTSNQQECGTYAQISGGSTTSYGQVMGSGCVYPATTLTLPDQLVAAGLTYHGYMEDMGNDTNREGATCGQTQPTATTGVYGGRDLTADDEAAPDSYSFDGYAQRHNPFVYFTSIISKSCSADVVPLNDNTLTSDLASIATTSNFTFISPNLCDDGHDTQECNYFGSSTYHNENLFLQKWVPIIMNSPAFQQDGLLMIAFDESGPAKSTADGTDTTFDATSCCSEFSEIDPNTQSPGIPPGSTGIADGSGGGKTGTILLSPYIAPGTVSGKSYNHYAALRSFEDEFGLSYLGFAGFPGTTSFGTDIYGTTLIRQPQHRIRLPRTARSAPFSKVKSL